MFTGQHLVDIAKQHNGKDYYWRTGFDGKPVIAEYDNKNYKGPWNCAEILSYCVYQAYIIQIEIKKNDASTASWNSDIDQNLSVQEIDIRNASKILGAIAVSFNNKIDHIVISDGKAKTWEASVEIEPVPGKMTNYIT